MSLFGSYPALQQITRLSAVSGGGTGLSLIAELCYDGQSAQGTLLVAPLEDTLIFVDCDSWKPTLWLAKAI